MSLALFSSSLYLISFSYFIQLLWLPYSYLLCLFHWCYFFAHLIFVCPLFIVYLIIFIKCGDLEKLYLLLHNGLLVQCLFPRSMLCIILYNTAQCIILYNKAATGLLIKYVVMTILHSCQQIRPD